ncbi:MAG: hypothetical protein A2469_00945 [Candidatus Magasanikbacteria bacterium RIFOXYC2_FULL_40_16]|uniref:GIY-YIG domain-containing protein n=3 Tax=Candidatus Magasanikiibacteriota TaxID=1752731 RepID=A0A1F6NHC2_9BACT|nr:MAG: hypothetical protein A2224_03055 [Candidatus Magasanikbacteria bacterium RIFOXYA2_FULL_40_20]OGH83245.1 MAG: hypothetical protein A2373_01680 [Candidatus Magasanikbacteria bacterium RIFOXYB1_FULL_40_15]OGH86463.1 MAG: hypothetical protein A2301_01170 [Candidatus Magasanikbacteria bacterium RIFOXYB2_FULL_40_13]OGH87058.1 MAG: hypothetical protein A2206_02615 [Candidatus Magasanikbacteria bacterium RIFOXYA1_FULL_40_8]OGH89528.1 MAG: hypothetical protein A2469_00945 [Candidatus Magasanikba
MYYVYIIKLSNNLLYTGRSDNLTRRMLEHNRGKVKATKNYRPIKLIYYEAFCVKLDTIRREKYLKTTQGKRMIKLMLKESIK